MIYKLCLQKCYLKSLHWLPIALHIKPKIFNMVYMLLIYPQPHPLCVPYAHVP